MTSCLSILKVDYNSVKFQDSDNVAEIKPFQNHLDKCRIEAYGNIINLVTEVRKSLETLKLDVFKVLSKKNDVNYLRRKMLGMEEKIAHTKEKIQEELIKALENEKVLFKDLKFFENHLENWGKSLNMKNLKPSKPRSLYRVNSSHLNNPTVMLQKFISESGGPYGGWLEQDHLLFIREQKKNKDKTKFYSTIHNFLPNLTDNDISEHESWCLKYETLRAAQKKAIQKWKEKKTPNQDSNSEKKIDDKEIKTIKKPAYQANIAERIKEWRKNQKAKKIEEIERQVQEKKLFQKQERARMNKIQQIKKLAISQYKAEKLKKLQSELPVEEEKILSVVDKAKKKILLKTFQLQDLKFIEKKKSIRLELESKAANKFHCLKLTKPPIDFFLQRDPKRIFKPTLIWTQHCIQNNNGSKEKPNQIINLNTIPKLAVPEWRKELKYN